MLLRIEGLVVSYGLVQALRGISLDVTEGNIVALLGANGAGKSTTLKAISGLVPIIGGIIEFRGQQIQHKAPEEIVKLGAVHVPEGRNVFPELTVMENLKMGGYLNRKNFRKGEAFSAVMQYFPRLRDRLKQQAGTLSGVEQQMLAIGRALMATPRLLMVDEPSLGLAPLLVKEVAKIIKALNSSGTTVLLVEQNAMIALSISDYAYVLELGKIPVHGNSADLMAHAGVKQAYLGI
jgi:branched-chain amino acid transport system ATP-binding protein